MEKMIIETIAALYYALPGLIANMLPIFGKKRLGFLAIPADFKKKFRSRRILGNNKTIRGFVLGICGGALIGLIQYFIQDTGFISGVVFIKYTLFGGIFAGAVFGFAALFGDALESFFKRQIGIDPGKPFIPFDQLDYIIGIIAFSFLIKPMTLQMIIGLLIAGPLLHILSTKIGYFLKIRKEKW